GCARREEVKHVTVADEVVWFASARDHSVRDAVASCPSTRRGSSAGGVSPPPFTMEETCSGYSFGGRQVSPNRDSRRLFVARRQVALRAATLYGLARCLPGDGVVWLFAWRRLRSNQVGPPFGYG